MFLYELGFLNGFTVDLDEEKSKNRDARRVELDDGKINFYYDDVSCLNAVAVCDWLVECLGELL